MDEVRNLPPLQRAAVYRQRAFEWFRRADEPDLDSELKAEFESLAKDYDGLAEIIESNAAD